MPSRWLIPLQ